MWSGQGNIVDADKFLEFHDLFMSLDLTYHQKQLFYMTAKMRYMGARPVRNPEFELAKEHLIKNGYKEQDDK